METKVLMENWKKYNENPYQLMLEQFDKKLINENQLYDRWEKEFLREFKQFEKEIQILEENVLSSVGKKAKKAATYLKDKVSDFILKKSIQLMEMGKKSAMAAFRGLVKLLVKAKKFAESHPLIVAGLIIVVVMMMSATAQASVVKGGVPIQPPDIDLVKGLIKYAADQDPMNTSLYEEAIRTVIEIQDAFAGDKAVDVSDMSKPAQKWIKLAMNWKNKVQTGQGDSAGALAKLIDAGENLYGKITIDGPGKFSGGFTKKIPK